MGMLYAKYGELADLRIRQRAGERSDLFRSDQVGQHVFYPSGIFYATFHSDFTVAVIGNAGDAVGDFVQRLVNEFVHDGFVRNNANGNHCDFLLLFKLDERLYGVKVNHVPCYALCFQHFDGGDCIFSVGEFFLVSFAIRADLFAAEVGDEHPSKSAYSVSSLHCSLPLSF
jgi:hypothetical protein